MLEAIVSKVQYHELFKKNWIEKILPGPHMIMQKRLREFLCFHEDIREKTCFWVVVDYADTVLA